MPNLLKYREYIDTECSQASTRLPVKALKLDGPSSLKEALGLANLKSCDYLRHQQGRLLLIEFSDLVRQHQNESDEYRQLKSLVESAGQHSLRKKLRKKIKTIEPQSNIREELRQKCIHTLLLLHYLAELKDFSLQSKCENGITYVVAICMHSPADVMAFQNLIPQLQASLKGLVNEVKVLPAQAIPEIVK